jgi:hypothetical protein
MRVSELDIIVTKFSVDYNNKHDIWNIAVMGASEREFLILSRSWSPNIETDGPEGVDLDHSGELFTGADLIRVEVSSGRVVFRMESGVDVVIVGAPRSYGDAVRFLFANKGVEVVSAD